ncbi:RDD family protein [Austwickia chelonae]|uniref:RDD family protein n=1 Tax=Austwickia chelonae TaxID=100225 RepID=UPI0013C2D898|nr:RDD family protein [Austwickia chelonae]
MNEETKKSAGHSDPGAAETTSGATSAPASPADAPAPVHPPAPSAPPTAPTPPVSSPLPQVDPRHGLPQHIPVAPTSAPAQQTHSLAPWWRRILAFLADLMLSVMMALPFTTMILLTRWSEVESWSADVQRSLLGRGKLPVTPESVLALTDVITVVTVLVYFSYELIGLGKFGTTLGRQMLGIKVVSRTGAPLTFDMISRRSAMKVIGRLLTGSPFLAGVGLFLTLFDFGRGLIDRNRCTIHDVLGSTQVVMAAPRTMAQQPNRFGGPGTGR